MKRLKQIGILMLSLNFQLQANCEAGGFYIHTTATYRPTDYTSLFLKLEKGDLTLTELDISSFFRSSQVLGLYNINHPNIWNCPKMVITRAPSNSSHNYQIESCNAISALENSYIHLDSVNKKATIGQSLVKTNSALPSPLLNKISSTIHKYIKKTDLMPRTDIGGTPQSGTINHTDILNINNIPITQTVYKKNDKYFVMSIAKLKLDKVWKYFNVHEPVASDSSMIKTFAIFPVIFFTKDNKTQYAGDGAWCSDVRPYYENQKIIKNIKNNDQILLKDKFGRYNLGEVHKFEITNAVDLTGDGLPDIIEINNSFAYLLEKDNSFTVINRSYPY